MLLTIDVHHYNIEGFWSQHILQRPKFLCHGMNEDAHHEDTRKHQINLTYDSVESPIIWLMRKSDGQVTREINDRLDPLKDTSYVKV